LPFFFGFFAGALAGLFIAGFDLVGFVAAFAGAGAGFAALVFSAALGSSFAGTAGGITTAALPFFPFAAG
jgi:hypothetical protein